MAFARPLCGSPVPTYKHFQPAVLKVLGRRLNLQPDTTVPVTDALRAEVIKEAGFDPDGLPEDWVKNRKSKTPAGIDTNINTAYRFLHWKTKGGRHGKAKTVAGKPGQWGLTPLGVIEAKALLPKPEPKKAKPKGNVTAQWLNKHLTPEPGKSESALHRKLRFAIAKKCRISASTDLVDDHVNQCIVRLIRRDALRKRLEEGRNVTYSHIATYAVNSAFTDIRDFGTDAVTREMFGARTHKERQETAEWIEKRQSGEIGPTVSQSFSGFNGIELNENRQIVAIEDTSVEEPVERIHFEKVWSRLEDVMKAAKPNAWERYIGILKMQILEDLPVKEIARREQVSPHRAATMLQEARRAVRAVGTSALLG